MKKQIIAAAVAASLSAVALADVSISGAAQVNITKKDDGSTKAEVTHDVDLKVVGKTGETSFVVDLENTSTTATLAEVTAANNVAAKGDALQVKNAYMTTNFGGLNVKAGEWYNGDSNLNNATQQNPRAEISTSVGAVGVKYAMEPKIQLHEMHLSADLAGVKVSYEQENLDNHKIMSVSGSLAGVDFAYTDSRSDNVNGVRFDTADDDGILTVVSGANEDTVTIAAVGGNAQGLDANNEQNMVISTNVGGMKIEYQKMKSKAGTSSDGFFGTIADATLLEADGFGITTTLAGNTVQIRNYKTTVEQGDAGTNGNEATIATETVESLNDYAIADASTADNHSIAAADVDRNTKIIVTRPLASGATAEFTYVTGDGTDMMDLEFRMAF
jgi:hypothetical protein